MAINNELKTKIVLRNDTAAKWEEIDPTLLEGEIGIENDTGLFKIGDGTTPWSELNYANKFEEVDLSSVANAVIQVEDEDELTHDGRVIGDVGIVKKPISEGIFSYTCYIWNGEQWAAADGNYNASNVILSKGITLSGDYGKDSRGDAITSIGNYRIGDTIGAGSSLESILMNIFSKRLQPTITKQPSVSVTLTGVGAKEVGSSFAPSWTVTLNDGTYTYAPTAAGVTATSYAVSDTNGKTSTSSKGTFDTFTVLDDTNYKVSATVEHTAGAVAKDNLGENSDPEIQIAAGSKTGNSSAVTGYRKPFWGYKSTSEALADPTKITSAQVRGLGNPGANNTNKWGTSATAVPATTKDTDDYKLIVPQGTKQIFFAVQSGKKSTLTITDDNALGAGIACTKYTSTIQVADARGTVEGVDTNTTGYDLWYVNLDGSFGKEGKLTLTWS